MLTPHLTAEAIIQTLGLTPHPEEGGWFRETWRAPESLPAEALPERYLSGHEISPRSAGTAIYYLLTPETFSAMHRLNTDEIFHFYLGHPVEMLLLHPDGRGETLLLGQDLASGMRPQVLVPHGTWQGARLAPDADLAQGGAVALMGCTVSPGFEYADYEHGRREELVRGWPQWERAIRERIHDDGRASGGTD